MKRLYFSIILGCIILVSACASSKDSYKVVNLSTNNGEKETTTGFQYMLPKTLIAVEVEVEKNEFEKGVYAEFATSLLGLSDVPSNNNAKYSIRNINISSIAEPDPKNVYFVDLGNSGLNLDICPSGILKSVNKKERTEVQSKSFHHKEEQIFAVKEQEGFADILLQPKKEMPKRKIFIQTDSSIQELPMLPTRKDSDKSAEAKAKEAADLIMSLQKKRISLISGEFEEQYNPEALQFLYDKLNALEKQYLSLFIGKNKTSTSKKIFYVDAANLTFNNGKSDVSLASFSENKGIETNESGLQGDIVLHINNLNTLALLSENQKKSEKKTVSEGFVYRIPEMVEVSLNYKDISVSKKMPVAQLGKTMSLPNKKMKIVLDPETGALQEAKIIKK